MILRSDKARTPPRVLNSTKTYILISIHNIAAKIVDHRTNRYIWSKEGGEITLECDAEGYPAPAISWVKEKELLESGPTTLQLSNLKLNDSQVIECWANNSNGFDARLYALEITSKLICFSLSEHKDRAAHIRLGGKFHLGGPLKILSRSITNVGEFSTF
jgi:hypothetical protein